MKKKVIIIGAVGGGATTASQIRKLDSEIEIILLEKTSYLSYGACGMPYYLGEVIKDRESLFAATPEKLHTKKNIDVRMHHEALKIDRDKKSLLVRDHDKNQDYEEAYDYLVLATGASPFIPDIPGLEKIPAFHLRTVEDMDRIKQFVETSKPKVCTIIGGGYIGVEMSENFTHLGMKVNLVERSEHVISVIDEETAIKLQEHITEQGVNLYTKDGLNEVLPECTLKLDSGETFQSDFILLSVGVKPNNLLAKEAGLSTGESGGVVSNEFMQTDDPSIYAVGDVVESLDLIDGTRKQVPLAWPAHRQAYIIARHLSGNPVPFKGMLGTAIAKVFNLSIGSTGLGEKELKEKGYSYRTSVHEGKSHAGYYPGARDVYVRVHFCPDTGKIFGGNVVGGAGVDKQIDVLATAIYGGLTITDLQEIETCYAPPFSSPKGLLNMIGYKGAGLMEKE
ncbi:CoA-disulfide reductase [Rossellomorea aquimaris]|uniref:NADPH-dependent 2,4-dienoyl-CoA reductase/sulfur reductase-like enzyme n=1 Tax=Rossellomorea aquimaris TaxID=189382 RepID=A0A366EML7_9BACI|nr:CoA-disulfide reductase [Rossellomorea aquimaris]RBP03638.1 NADPH-dependent 2,4-dienoyl-CoA reductase/sulfur reductase-like enzyme [Rossellomorea aquimaris]